MRVLGAVVQVLKEVGRPLTSVELAQRVLAEKLWETSGKTPDATISAAIYMDIKNKGENSLFVKVAPNTFVLKNKGKDEVPKSVKKSKLAESSSDVEEKTVDPRKGYSFLECAERVLGEQASREPMHYLEITRIAQNKGWLVSSGKTPSATIYAQILSDIKHRSEKGETSRFVKYGKGLVGLSRWMATGLAAQIRQLNRDEEKKLLKRLRNMTPGEFEELVGELLIALGFEDVEVTKLSGDGGIDVRGILVVGDVVRIRMAVQVKRWKKGNNVLAPVVQQVRGSLAAHEQGLIITTSDFSKGAVEEAGMVDKKPIALMNGEQLVRLMMEHDIGVRRIRVDLFEQGEIGR